MSSGFLSGRISLLSSALLLVAVYTLACDNPVHPRTPSQLLMVSGSDQLVDLGLPWQDPLVVEVLDSHGSPVPGVSVTWRVTSGGGTLSPKIAETDQWGRATVTAVADTVAGLQTVAATAASLGPVVFSATALPGPPAEIRISTLPFLQVGETRQLDVQVLDRYGNEISPVFLDWISSDVGVVSVSPGGVLHAVGEGTVTISAIFAAIVGSTTVSVASPLG